MKVLSIDTTSMLGAFALTDGEEVIACVQQTSPKTHSEGLFDVFNGLFRKAGWTKNKLQGLAVAVGPGSFTGLRIGLAAAKGMALALEIPIAGISSLKSLALNGVGNFKTVVSLVDARRGELYAFAASVAFKNSIETVLPECVLQPQTLIEKLREIGGPFFVVGDGALAYRNELEKSGLDIEIPDGEKVLPIAQNLASLALPVLKTGGLELSVLSPNYVRRSDAEIGFLGR
jgi:tRNA threonylcarbamoyladenosine biosynthesis protein TsaB